MKALSTDEPQLAVLDEQSAETNPLLVVISRVTDPAKLLDARSRRMHTEVVDALVDLTIALLDEEGAGHEGPGH